MSEFGGVEVEIIDLTEIVGDLEMACEYAYLECCKDRAAKWIVFLTPCGGHRMGGPRLICEDCKNYVMATEDCAECGVCGEVVYPFRHVFSHIEPLDKR